MRKGQPWSPSRHFIERRSAGWRIDAGVDLGAWTVMGCFDRGPAMAGVGFGPLRFFLQRDEPPTNWHFGWTLIRLLVPRLRLEMRFDLDLGFWAFGYAMADAHDHGLYFGPLNLQIEYEGVRGGELDRRPIRISL